VNAIATSFKSHGCLLVLEAAAERVDVALVAERTTEIAVSPVRVRSRHRIGFESRLLSPNFSQRRGAENAGT
jgi:hypothetical protein